jgi:hypothetical protein
VTVYPAACDRAAVAIPSVAGERYVVSMFGTIAEFTINKINHLQRDVDLVFVSNVSSGAYC